MALDAVSLTGSVPLSERATKSRKVASRGGDPRGGGTGKNDGCDRVRLILVLGEA